MLCKSIFLSPRSFILDIQTDWPNTFRNGCHSLLVRFGEYHCACDLYYNYYHNYHNSYSENGKTVVSWLCITEFWLWCAGVRSPVSKWLHTVLHEENLIVKLKKESTQALFSQHQIHFHPKWETTFYLVFVFGSGSSRFVVHFRIISCKVNQERKQYSFTL